MPAPETAYRRQDAVLWPAASVTGYGETTVGTPVDLRVRWVWGRKDSLDANGNTIALDAEVVVDREIAQGSLMIEGTYADWLGVGSAGNDAELMEVVTYDEATDLKGRFTRRSVGLRRYKGSLPS